MAAKKRPARKTTATRKEPDKGGGEKTGKKAVAKGQEKTTKKAWAFPGRETLAIAGGVAAILAINVGLGLIGAGWSARLASFLGIAFLLGLALLMSADRRRIPLRTVLVGLGLQLAIGLLALRTPLGNIVFRGIGRIFDVIFKVSGKGGMFVFGDLAKPMPVPPFTVEGCVVLAITLVSIIVFMGAMSRILYHWGVLQPVVRGMAWLMRRLMRASGAESLSAGANVFVGMVEAPLTIRPYVAGLTRSELFCVMTAGMATVAGSVLAFYALTIKGVLGDAAAGHLLTASVMSAPAAVLLAKIIIPETETPATLDADVVPAMVEEHDRPVNTMDAAARGGLEGLKLGINVVGLLIAFVAIVAFVDAILGGVSGGRVTFQGLAGWLFSPVALGMGVPLEDATAAGSLMGTKTVLNELLAYKQYAEVGAGLTDHTRLVMSYALCGFANFGSVAIMIAGVGGIAPNQRPNLARLGLLSIVSGSLAAFLTGCWAGLLG